MKNVLRGVSALAFAAFGVVTFISMLALGLQALTSIFPTDPVNRYLGIVLYDIAALIWLGVFIFRAEGTAQRALSLTMFALSFLGAVALVAAQVRYSAGFVAPEDLRQAVSLIFIVTIVLQLAAIYGMKLAAPDVQLAIEMRTAQDSVVGQAIEDAKALMDQNRQAMAASLATLHFNNARAALGLTSDNRLMLESPDEDAIVDTETNADAFAPGRFGFLSRLSRSARAGQSAPSPAQAADKSSNPAAPKPEPAPADAGQESTDKA